MKEENKSRTKQTQRREAKLQRDKERVGAVSEEIQTEAQRQAKGDDLRAKERQRQRHRRAGKGRTS